MSDLNEKSDGDKFIDFFNLKRPLEYNHINKKPSKGSITAVFAYYIFIYAVFLITAELFRGYGIMDLLKATKGIGFDDLVYVFPTIAIILISLYIFAYFEESEYKHTICISSNIVKSILLGLIASAFYYIFVKYDKLLMLPASLGDIWRVIYLFIYIALTEELLFRGFLQPRIGAIFDKKCRWVSFIIVGWMWGILHIPMGTFKFDVSMMALFLNIPFNLKFIMYHIVLSYLSTRFNNILPAVILHFFIDL